MSPAHRPEVTTDQVIRECRRAASIHSRQLSRQQRQLRRVYEMLVNTPFSLKEIAWQLGMPALTVKVYTSRLYETLNVSGGRIELMHREIVRLGGNVGCLSYVEGSTV